MNAEDEKDPIADSGISSFGTWVRDSRIKADMSVQTLARLAGIAVSTLYGIESGKFQNPQTDTKDKLAKALNLPPPKPDEKLLVVGLGPLVDFDPYLKKDWPKCPGVYVLYDISQRPVYIGKSIDISTRLNHHLDRFWFKAPIVDSASYIEVKDEILRTQLEQVLIKVLKNNAVINVKGVTSSH